MMAQLELGNGGCIYCDNDDGFLRVVVMIVVIMLMMVEVMRLTRRPLFAAPSLK
jgi:hypothetical protein